jgi:hypothetical protein
MRIYGNKFELHRTDVGMKSTHNYEHANINIVEAISNSKSTNKTGYTEVKENDQEDNQDQVGINHQNSS